MTQDQRSNRVSLNFRPGRNGAACAATTIGVPEQGPNPRILTAMMPGKPDRLDPCLQPIGRMLRWSIAEGSSSIQRP
jgi:hypothetical protein